MNKDAYLQIHNLHCRRGQRLLFSHLSLQLNEGEMLWVKGENGSGKSSLLRLLAGIARPDEGDIAWCGNNIQNLGHDYAKHLHYLGHSNGIKPSLSVSENMQLTCHLLKNVFSLEKIPEEMQLHSLQHNFAKSLSAGQKRKLALAKLFLVPRKLWILDEPLTSLDAGTQLFFLSCLEKHLQQGGMTIITSHHPSSLLPSALRNWN